MTKTSGFLSTPMKRSLVLLCLGLAGGFPSAAEFPQAEISNGQIRAKLYLPDPATGYYRGTRFDWSGVIGSLEYQGHNYYGPWFDRIDPHVLDFIYQGSEIVAGPCSAITGPAEEFQTNGSALGWDEAKAGETFVKIGVGVLRKDDAPYYFAKRYELVDAGKWTVKPARRSVEFLHQLSAPALGYGYVYRKTVKLTRGKAELVLEHRLQNTGRRPIQSRVYNHNFLVLDRQPPGPDFSLTVPFPIQTSRPPNPSLAEIRGNQIVYRKALAGQEVVQTPVEGFSQAIKDHQIRIENRAVRAGVQIRGDRPLAHNALWSIRTVLAMEPFIAMDIPPGGEFSWDVTYEYFTLPPRP